MSTLLEAFHELNAIDKPVAKRRVKFINEDISKDESDKAKVSDKEDVCPECGKEICECDKQPVEECDLQEAIEDEVNNGEIYSPNDFTDEDIDDMLDWMLHNGHYGKYTYNLDTVEGYQRVVSDAALNLISDEGIEPKSATARDLRGTSEFKELEQLVRERLKVVYGIDPHDFDADMVESTNGLYEAIHLEDNEVVEDLDDILKSLNEEGLNSMYADKHKVREIESVWGVDPNENVITWNNLEAGLNRAERDGNEAHMVRAYMYAYMNMWYCDYNQI